MGRHASTLEGELTGGILKLGLLVLILLLLCLVGGLWLSVKAGHLVFRVLRQHPDSKPVWVTLGGFGGSLLVLVLAGVSVWTLLFCALSLGALLLTARLVELYSAELCQPQKREPLIEEILRKPWWPQTQKNKQAA